MKLSIIIPVFNEEKTIRKVIEAVLSIRIPTVILELIIVNDGSTDATTEEIKKAAVSKKFITVISHAENQGKGAAVRSGLKHATGEYVLIQDADLEYNPLDIQHLVSALDKQNKVIYGTRLKRFPHLGKEERKVIFFIHFFGNRFLSLVVSLLYGQWVTDIETGYKLFPRKVLDTIQLKSNDFAFEAEITTKLMKKGEKISEIPIKTNPRDYSQGKKLRTIPDGCKALWTILKYRVI